MKKIKILLAALGLMSSINAFAETGSLFSAVFYGATLSVIPTINHYYPNVGIKLTSNNALDGTCTPSANGFCLFGASMSMPKSFTFTGSDTPSGVICLDGVKEFSCQQFTATAGGPPGPFSLCTGANPTCRVFVTNATFNGAFGGLGVDSVNAACQTAATNAGLNGTWKAWASDSTPPAAPANIGYTATTTYVRATQTFTIVAAPNTLLGGSLNNPVLLTEIGTIVSGTPEVWTGTTTSGTVTASMCDEWSNADIFNSGTIGNATSTTANWTILGTSTCDQVKHVYCFEEPV